MVTSGWVRRPMIKELLYRSAENLAREHTSAAIYTIADVMSDPYAENKDRLKAAELLLDRGHGRPTSTVISVPPAKRQREMAARMTDEQLMEVIEGEVLPSMAQLTDQQLAMAPGDLSDPDVVDPLCL